MMQGGRTEGGTASSLSEAAYRAVKRMILTGELAGGAQINEAELAISLGISRTPMRESLLRLKHEGLLTIVPYKGVFVAQMSLNDIRDLMQLRFCTEEFAIREAAAIIGDADIAALNDLIAQQEDALANHDAYRFMELDGDFHLRIVHVLGNRRMDQIVAQLRDQLVACGIRGLRKPGRFQQVVAEHREIVRFLQAHDSAGAVSSLHGHLVAIRDSVIEF